MFSSKIKQYNKANCIKKVISVNAILLVMQFLQENSINARNLQPKIIFDVFVIGETDSLSATSRLLYFSTLDR